MLSRFGRSHIYLFLPDLVGILLFPSLLLRRLELHGGKVPLLAVSDAEIFLFGLVLPCAVRIEGPHDQQDMGVRIVTGRVGIMNRRVRAHSLGDKRILNEIGQQLLPLIGRQLDGQCRYKLPGKAAVLHLFRLLHGIPENAPVTPLFRSAVRKEDLLTDKSAFPGVVVLNAVVIVQNGRTAHISRCRHSRATRPPAHDFRFEMVDCHRSIVPLSPARRPPLLLLFTKR